MVCEIHFAETDITSDVKGRVNSRRIRLVSCEVLGFEFKIRPETLSVELYDICDVILAVVTQLKKHV